MKEKLNYFTALTEECEVLNKKARAYLDTLPFISNQECMNRIFKRAAEIFEEANEDWGAVPEWVADTMDGWMPYSGVPQNGSMYFSLGFSPVSLDAHLRNLLEIAEGRETKELDFDIVVNKDEFHRKIGLEN